MKLGLEAIDYPFVPGEKGIQMNHLFERLHNGEERGVLLTGSGRELDFIGNSFFLKISDTSIPCYFHMWAILGRERFITFGLQTIREVNGNGQKITAKHPDMFAGKFIGIALSYFKGRGMDIWGCRGVWTPNSDNYEFFMHEYQRSADKVLAAKATWSAKRFAEYGYDNIEEDDISLEYLPGEKELRVQALFWS